MSMAKLLRIGDGFDLRSVDTRSTPGFQGDKAAGEAVLQNERDELAELQEKLFACARFGDERRVLLLLQAMDTAGKGGIVKHVVGSVDPQGVDIAAFKAPTEEEKTHDFLWRVRRRLPQAGMIGVFDRSHYEDVLIHRVHELTPLDQIEQRYDQIVEFEREVVTSGTTLIKVMLHISPKEQKKRLADRLERPDKHWKYSPGDITERAHWDDYMTAYQTALDRTNEETAPWYVVPADRKWYARLAVHRLLLGALRGLGQDWPKADFDVETELHRLAAS